MSLLLGSTFQPSDTLSSQNPLESPGLVELVEMAGAAQRDALG